MSEETAGPGWYPDPSDEGLLRYWDGDRWTEYTDQNWQAKAAEQGVAATGAQPTGAAYVPRGQTNGQAIASLILGILNFACFPLFWVAGLPIGISARRQIREGNGQGDGIALAGVIINSIAAALAAIGLVVLLVFLVAATEIN